MSLKVSLLPRPCISCRCTREVAVFVRVLSHERTDFASGKSGRNLAHIAREVVLALAVLGRAAVRVISRDTLHLMRCQPEDDLIVDDHIYQATSPPPPRSYPTQTRRNVAIPCRRAFPH